MQLWNIVLSDETLKNVIASVTRSWQSIALTALLALILVFHYAIVGYMRFQQHFDVDDEDDATVLR